MSDRPETPLLDTVQYPADIRALSKDQLLTQVWGYDAYDPNLVEVHVSSLRRKLEHNGPRMIQTVRGIGYRFAA